MCTICQWQSKIKTRVILSPNHALAKWEQVPFITSTLVPMVVSVVVAWAAYLQRNLAEPTWPKHGKSLHVSPDLCIECSIKQANGSTFADPSLHLSSPSLANSWLGPWPDLSHANLQRIKSACGGGAAALLCYILSACLQANISSSLRFSCFIITSGVFQSSLKFSGTKC